MRALRLLRVELTVAELDAAAAFYAALPGMALAGRVPVEPAMAELLGATTIEQVTLRRGEQFVVLQRFVPGGAPYPDAARSCDAIFQHIALPTADATAATAGLPAGAAAISRGGAQHLPARSGGATAFKFRDPEGHPLELIQFADGHLGGFDHSAIVVADAARSIDFYQRTLGLRVGARQNNRGPEQDRLDGLDGAEVEVVALEPATATPHLELLAYREPTVRTAPATAPADVAAARLVFAVDRVHAPAARLADGSAAALLRDPDGHQILVLGPA